MNDSFANRKRRFGATAAVVSGLVSALAICGIARADLQPGEWTGTITPPEGVSAPATFTVGEAEGMILISVLVVNMSFDFRDIEVTDDAVRFTWTPGIDVHCDLGLQEDDSYSGECIDEAGDTGYITMVPPE